MPEPGRSRWSGSALWGIGFELAAAVAGFTLVGYWVDRHYRTYPWGVLIGLALGLVGGMYNLIRDSLAASRQARSETETTDGRRR
jgi:F0F1-type ATP synthase assembly protein I